MDDIHFEDAVARGSFGEVWKVCAGCEFMYIGCAGASVCTAPRVVWVCVCLCVCVYVCVCVFVCQTCLRKHTHHTNTQQHKHTDPHKQHTHTHTDALAQTMPQS